MEAQVLQPALYDSKSISPAAYKNYYMYQKRSLFAAESCPDMKLLVFSTYRDC